MESLVKKPGEDTFGFDQLNLDPRLLNGINAYRLSNPAEFQKHAVVSIIPGNIVLAEAEPGTDYTATFSIAILKQINSDNPNCQAMVLAPNRSSLEKIYSILMSLGSFMSLTCHKCSGRRVRGDDWPNFHGARQVAIGTPARILDLMLRGILLTAYVRVFVVDEVDRMMEQDFKDIVYEVKKCLRGPLQVMAFSTRMCPQEVLKATRDILHDSLVQVQVEPEPEVYSSSSNEAQDESKSPKSDNALAHKPSPMAHFRVSVRREEDKISTLLGLFYKLSIGEAVIFCNGRQQVEHVAGNLTESNLAVSTVIGSTDLKDRMIISDECVIGSNRFLVTTEVSAGINVRATTIINYDLPAKTHYKKRIESQAGGQDKAKMMVSLVTDEEQEQLKVIEELLNIQITEMHFKFNN